MKYTNHHRAMRQADLFHPMRKLPQRGWFPGANVTKVTCSNVLCYFLCATLGLLHDMYFSCTEEI